MRLLEEYPRKVQVEVGDWFFTITYDPYFNRLVNGITSKCKASGQEYSGNKQDYYSAGVGVGRDTVLQGVESNVLALAKVMGLAVEEDVLKDFSKRLNALLIT